MQRRAPGKFSGSSMRVFQLNKQLALLACGRSCRREKVVIQSRSILRGLSCMVPVRPRNPLLRWRLELTACRPMLDLSSHKSHEIPGQKSPATRRCSIAAGVAVGRHSQRVYLGPLHLQPAAIHQAAGVPRIGIPAPAQRSHDGCLADECVQQNLHKQQSMSSPAMACAGDQERQTPFLEVLPAIC